MTDGYTVVFRTIYTGTLYGRWPAAAVMATLLPLANKRGEIDMSVDAICGMTGWPRDLLIEGIEQLMQPDPYSRTPGHDGVRLELIDPARPWGWRLINHAQYRERARKRAWDAERTASGRDAERKRRHDVSRRVPTTPDVPGTSRDSPLSEAEAEAEEKNKTPTAPPCGAPGLWSEGLRQVLKWQRTLAGGRMAPVFSDEGKARAWIGSQLTTGTWAEVGLRGEHCRVPAAGREAKLLEILERAGDKKSPKAYAAGAVRNLVKRHQTMVHQI